MAKQIFRANGGGTRYGWVHIVRKENGKRAGTVKTKETEKGKKKYCTINTFSPVQQGMEIRKDKQRPQSPLSPPGQLYHPRTQELRSQ